MQRVAVLGVLALLAAGCSNAAVNNSAGGTSAAAGSDGWISLFDGQTLNGWRASENPATFRVENGTLVVDGPRAHLFYVGPVRNHDFKNFEFKADVMTRRGANSGMYFHTAWQETGWPSRGYEVQVNNTHTDRRKTGSLYAIQDVLDNAPAQDDQWFTQHIIVQGKRVRVLVNGRQVVDYTEPDNVTRPNDMAGRLLSRGTFALQGHDPQSVVYYRNIMVRPLPD